MAGFRNGGGTGAGRNLPDENDEIRKSHPHEIALTHWNTLHIEQIIGRGDMKEEIWEKETENVSFPVQFHRLIGANWQSDYHFPVTINHRIISFGNSFSTGLYPFDQSIKRLSPINGPCKMINIAPVAAA